MKIRTSLILIVTWEETLEKLAVAQSVNAPVKTSTTKKRQNGKVGLYHYIITKSKTTDIDS